MRTVHAFLQIVRFDERVFQNASAIVTAVTLLIARRYLFEKVLWHARVIDRVRRKEMPIPRLAKVEQVAKEFAANVGGHNVGRARVRARCELYAANQAFVAVNIFGTHPASLQKGVPVFGAA